MKRTLRLKMPQWQGGNNPPYNFGSQLLAWLAPVALDDVEAEVPVEAYDGTALLEEGGVIGRSVLLKQLRSAGKIIEAHQPDRIITFGGDCLVSQAPFAYLNERYDGKLGILWLDAHPDVSTPDMHKHVHAMVLGNLLGEGDLEFAAEVKCQVKPDYVMYGGLKEMTGKENEIVNRLRIRQAGAEELAQSSGGILDWIMEKEIKHLAIHLDLDVLDPGLFRSLLFANPDGEKIDSSQGSMTLGQIGRVIQDVSEAADVVGFSFAEYLPWDAINMREFLTKLPVFH